MENPIMFVCYPFKNSKLRITAIISRFSILLLFGKKQLELTSYIM